MAVSAKWYIPLAILSPVLSEDPHIFLPVDVSPLIESLIACKEKAGSTNGWNNSPTAPTVPSNNIFCNVSSSFSPLATSCMTLVIGLLR